MQAAAAALQPLPADPCSGEPACVRASAEQLFDAAEKLVAEGNTAGAEELLLALTQDPKPEYRAEARFRLAGLREVQGDREGAIRWLRELLAEQPDAKRARLELGRLLALTGDATGARRELARAQEVGLPADVARTVSRFSNLLGANKRRGGSIEITAGADSNVNRATSGRFVDTVIAPFELDADARRQSGVGITGAVEGYSRDKLADGVNLLTRGGIHADLFAGKSRFNDIQLYAGTGPELASSAGRIRPALTVERRWFGGDVYSSGIGGALSWVSVPTSKSQIEIDASIVRQEIHDNDALDGTRYAAALTYDRALGSETTARLNLRGAILDAEENAEGVNQAYAQLILARDLGFANLFGDAGYTKTHGRGELQLFGTTRDDDRLDLGAGVVARRTFSGFAPVLRLTHSRNWSNIEIYDFKRTRLDVGLTRQF
jgi:tetratricopeptide (TPR) repeat protein